MAAFLTRWRTPLITGVGLWILSFPLLTSHPTVATRPVAAAMESSRWQQDDLRILGRVAVEREAAQNPPVVAEAAVAAPAPARTFAATAVASIARAAAPARPAPPAAPAAPAVHANQIIIPRLGVSLYVGWYGDCLGRAAVPRYGAWRWSCAGANNTYIMAHNPGTFTPILGLRAGDIVKYGDPAGRIHTYRVSSTTIVSNTQMWPLGATAVSSLTLQTCWTWDGSRDFIVRAVEI
jgi:sortase (surface protein transpeptidase)